ALRYAQRLTGEHMVVALCADTGRNYLSKFFDDRWLAENKLSWSASPAHSLADLLRTRGPRQLVTTSPDASVESASQLMQASGIPQLPVLDAGKAVGRIQEVTLGRVVPDEGEPDQIKVGEIMAKALPVLDATMHLDEAYRLLLAGNTGVLAV